MSLHDKPVCILTECGPDIKIPEFLKIRSFERHVEKSVLIVAFLYFV
jgi:hypothetical protein